MSKSDFLEKDFDGTDYGFDIEQNGVDIVRNAFLLASRASGSDFYERYQNDVVFRCGCEVAGGYLETMIQATITAKKLAKFFYELNTKSQDNE